jgi:tetratricopeptide (TPR) repeat protein
MGAATPAFEFALAAALASALNTLALLFADQGRHAEAEPLYKRTIAIVEKALGPDHCNLGVTPSTLASLHQKQGHFAEAVPLAMRALAIAEKADGPDDPNVAVSVNNLASLYEAQGGQRSLAIREKGSGRAALTHCRYAPTSRAAEGRS